ncbi:unnamed protein product [Blepharisma stoltei]|uniref:phosphopyruvate hydratase n=1 Tax=Blepharisma stoltei TaxID=1481888 RepID=A0AAU9KDK3_9CILI|nr:unnamed protein product [Blepharisma stoltei]
MADSPLITRELREYISRFKVEEIISQGVNEVARNLPTNPYTFLAGFFAELSEDPPLITDIRARELLLETRPTIEVSIECESKGQRYWAPAFAFSPGIDEASYLLDGDRWDGKGMLTAARSAESLRDILREQDVTNQRKIDSLIAKEQGLGTNISVSLSFACAVAAAYFKKVPLYQHIFDKMTRREWEGSPLPKLMIPLLYTGKSVNSKVKFSRFFLYETRNESRAPQQQYEACKKLYDTMRRLLVAGKGGEAGLKQFQCGFIPNNDLINDCLKLCEDCVNQSGFVMGEDYLIGIDCNADDYYNRDTNKYEMEGQKNPPDVNQLTEFYLKMLNDKPNIGFLQDPFYSEDINAYKNLQGRLVNNKRISAFRACKTHLKVKELMDPEQGEESKAAAFAPHLLAINYTNLVTDIVDSAKIAAKKGTSVIITENPVESLDTALVDLALGLKAEFLQLSAPIRSGLLAKYNRILEIRNH